MTLTAFISTPVPSRGERISSRRGFGKGVGVAVGGTGVGVEGGTGVGEACRLIIGADVGEGNCGTGVTLRDNGAGGMAVLVGLEKLGNVALGTGVGLEGRKLALGVSVGAGSSGGSSLPQPTNKAAQARITRLIIRKLVRGAVLPPMLKRHGRWRTRRKRTVGTLLSSKSKPESMPDLLL